MKKFLRALRMMHSLKQLHLVNMDELESQIDVLADSIGKLKELTLLDVTNDKLRTRDVSGLVPLLTKNKTI